MKIINLLERLIGFVGGAICGTIIGVVIKINYFGGLPLLPISDLILNLLPGFVIGGILGIIFYKIFGKIAELILNIEIK